VLYYSSLVGQTRSAAKDVDVLWDVDLVASHADYHCGSGSEGRVGPQKTPAELNSTELL
jgi:hypothetical protein